MKKVLAVLLAAGVFGLGGCAKPAPEVVEEAVSSIAEEPAAPAGDLTGSINIDGSSTVYPISEAVAEEFRKVQPGVTLSVSFSGTGGGFKKFAAAEIDITGASRPIKDKEAEACAANSVEYIELPVAFDGLAVMVNPANDWVDHLTVDELKKIWEPTSAIKSWKDVRAGFPDVPLMLFGPGKDSGTFDYFTQAIVGEEGEARADFQPSEDDNVLVQGIAGDKGSLGFFGYAYYAENKDKLKLVPVKDGDKEPVAPSDETINNGSYTPLSRPIFIYVNKAAADRPEIDAFVQFYLAQAPNLVPAVGYTVLPARAYELAAARYTARTTGSVFAGGSQTGVTIDEILAKEQ